ncbi:MAG: LptF/LptG family permease [Verrucomicrobia bacterium]|nr:LptF/LptG family permease [Verrucomicrobiota bacterium]
MKFLQPVLNLLSFALRWLRNAPHAMSCVWLGAAGVMFLCIQAGYHESFMPETPSNVLELPKDWTPPPMGAYVFLYLLSYLRLFVLLGGVVYHAYIIRAYPDVQKMLRPTWIASTVLTVWALATNFYDRWEQSQVGVLGEEFSNIAFAIQIFLMVGLLMSPPFAMLYYIRCRIMERYALRNMLQPLLFCFLAFTTLWIVMDLKDHLENFRENNISGSVIFLFYIKLLPTIYVTIAPVTLLLATLYSLGKMSRANEIISMLGAGRSLGQVLRPFFIIGIYASLLGVVANYHWAPMAEGNKKKLLEDVKEHMKQDILVMDLVYHNNEDRRTWFVGIVPSDLRRERMRRIEVRQEDEKGHLVKAWFARSMAWWPENRVWTFNNGAEVSYENGIVVGMKNFKNEAGSNRLDQPNWNETPWMLMSNSLSPEFLGVPQLISYLSANRTYGPQKLAPYISHLFYRFALPMQAFVVVLMAAPLGVVFSRRGMLGGVAGSIFIFFTLLFIDHLFLNLGKSRHMPAFLSVWMPHLILGGVGLYLYQLRSQNRDLPKYLVDWKLQFERLKILWLRLKQKREPRVQN